MGDSYGTVCPVLLRLFSLSRNYSMYGLYDSPNLYLGKQIIALEILEV